MAFLPRCFRAGIDLFVCGTWTAPKYLASGSVCALLYALHCCYVAAAWETDPGHCGAFPLR